MIESIAGFAYDCKNAKELADFYYKLLGWDKITAGEGWAGLRSPQGWILAFQEVDEYIPPVWPWRVGEQQQMTHIDFKVKNLDESVRHALQCGAKKSEVQFYEDSTVMFDPEGHPFCLSTADE